MTATEPDHADILAWPVLIYLAGLAAGLLLDVAWPRPFLADAIQYPVGALLIVVCLIGVAAGGLSFRRAGTSVWPDAPSSALVTEGPYRVSRNPIYVAMTFGYLGLALAIDSLWLVAMLVPVLAVMTVGVIIPEERYLERRYGDDYRCYKRSVRRWL